ncbi:MATE family efflux transporter [Qiania dongpingensis]|uniref:Probable multidrug resistance protein NorM n=1 Tax=Qiania dongpingensis TaxID=2763669 RepID=A0A7G9G4J0_9FIRM|nr:MATE family efflux transporter [Qiania dongpingensis]QNM05722.1 MATE family efflux transporter [Qiania dongpingensis]
MAKDMSVGKPFPTLFKFAMPMVLGNLFQQLYNVVDSMVVGNFVGEDALAAVGTTTAITFLFIAIAIGMGIGCSVVISQLFGAKNMDTMKLAIHTALISMLVLSVILSIFGLAAHEWILRSMKVPENIFADAAAYLRIYCMGLVFLFMYNILNSIFNALGESRFPLIFLTMSSILNVILDLYFVIGLHMGVPGVAWATLIAQGISAVLSFLVLIRSVRRIETIEKPALFSGHLLGQMFRLAVPTTIQQSIVSLGLVFVQGLVNSYGSVVIAGYTAATKIDTIAINPMVQVGNAVSTFTAQNMGAKKTERVKSGMCSGLIIASSISVSLAVILYFFGGAFIGAFMDSGKSAEAIGVGVHYMRVVSSFYVVMGTMNVFNGVLRGAGDVRVFMLATLCNFSVRVAGAHILAASPMGASGIWWAIPIGWIVGALISGSRFASGRWKTKKLAVTEE